jgi:DNA-binding MarR family transcriptional regulator
MEAKGLVYRQPDETDKRSVRIFLTDKGKKKKEVSRSTVLRFNQEVRKEISPDKLEAFFEVINEVNKIIDNNSIYD